MNKSIKRTIAAVSMTAMLAAGFALPVSAATQVEVTGNPVMIRADAGLKNTVVSKAHKGDKYVYVGQKKDSTGRVWYNIKYSGNKTGWRDHYGQGKRQERREDYREVGFVRMGKLCLGNERYV